MSHSMPTTVPLQVQLALAAAQRGVIDAQQTRELAVAQQRETEQRATHLCNATSLAFSWRTLRCCVCNEDIYNERVMLISTPNISYRHLRCVPANFFEDTTCITRIPGFHNIPGEILYDEDDEELYNDLNYLISTTPRRPGRKPVYAG